LSHVTLCCLLLVVGVPNHCIDRDCAAKSTPFRSMKNHLNLCGPGLPEVEPRERTIKQALCYALEHSVPKLTVVAISTFAAGCVTGETHVEQIPCCAWHISHRRAFMGADSPLQCHAPVPPSSKSGMPPSMVQQRKQ